MIALITGAGRGIGKAIAIAVARKGFHTVLVARSENEIQAVAAQIIASGGKATAFACDITDSAAVSSLHEKISAIGRISLLINNAGVAPSVKLEATTDEMWRNTF